MRGILAKLVTVTLLVPYAFAAEVPPGPPELVLDKIGFQVSAKQWVTTQSALLGVSINVTLSSADLVKARSDIMERLNKIAAGEWHLLEFDRSQDNSGLEKLDVQAQARVNQTALTDIYKNAKAVSIPGAKYEISSVEFKPGFDETQVAQEQVRQSLYQKVNEEVARINKVYPGQNYSVSQLFFVEGSNPVSPRLFQAKEMNTMAMAAPAPVLAVSNELIMTAVVEVASNRKL